MTHPAHRRIARANAIAAARRCVSPGCHVPPTTWDATGQPACVGHTTPVTSTSD